MTVTDVSPLLDIEGQGTINGNGDAFWEPNFKAKPKRPMQMIELVHCRNVRIHDIRIRNMPAWGIHPWDCDAVYIRGINMITDMRGPNTDGIKPDSSRNMFISDSYIEGGDDAICLKTTRRSDGKPAPACEHVTVTNCVLISDDSAIKLAQPLTAISATALSRIA